MGPRGTTPAARVAVWVASAGARATHTTHPCLWRGDNRLLTLRSRGLRHARDNSLLRASHHHHHSRPLPPPPPSRRRRASRPLVWSRRGRCCRSKVRRRERRRACRAANKTAGDQCAPAGPTPRPPSPDRAPDGVSTHQQLAGRGGGRGSVASVCGDARARAKSRETPPARAARRRRHPRPKEGLLFLLTPSFSLLPHPTHTPGPSFSKPRHLILHNDSTGCTQTPAAGAASLTPDDLARPRPNTWAEEAVAVVTMLLFFR